MTGRKREVAVGYSLIGIGLFVLFVITFVMTDGQGMTLFKAFTAQKPKMPEGYPQELDNINYIKEYSSRKDSSGLIVYGNNSSSIKFIFDEEIDTPEGSKLERINSLDGRWYSNNCYIETEGAVENKFLGVPEFNSKSWDDKVITSPHRQIKPSFVVDIPVNEAYLHKYINIRARMHIIYPVAENPGKMDNVSRNIFKEFKAYVISPEELEYVKWLHRYDFLMSPGIVGVLLTLIFGTALVAAGLRSIQGKLPMTFYR